MPAHDTADSGQSLELIGFDFCITALTNIESQQRSPFSVSFPSYKESGMVTDSSLMGVKGAPLVSDKKRGMISSLKTANSLQ